jgi:hypothetical protein
MLREGTKVRYIRDWLNGSTSNTGNHWVEIMAFTADGNVAQGKPVSGSASVTNGVRITDGSTTTTSYAQIAAGAQWVIVDLLDVHLIDYLHIWHYNLDGRSYYGTKTEVSEDGTNWYVVFDSAISGIYQETTAGKIHKLGKPSIKDSGTVVAGTFSECSITNGLVAWYPLQGDAIDYANRNDGVVTGAVPSARGYSFTTAAHTITHAGVTAVAGSITIMAWVNYDKSSPMIGDNFYGWFYSNGLRVSVHGHNDVRVDWNGIKWSGTRTNGYKLAPFSWGQWALVGITFSSGVLTTWHNADRVWDVTGQSNASISSTTVLGQNFPGNIADVRIYNRALSAEEINILYHTTNPDSPTKMKMTEDSIYIQGQFKENF